MTPVHLDQNTFYGTKEEDGEANFNFSHADKDFLKNMQLSLVFMNIAYLVFSLWNKSNFSDLCSNINRIKQ